MTGCAPSRAAWRPVCPPGKVDVTLVDAQSEILPPRFRDMEWQTAENLPAEVEGLFRCAPPSGQCLAVDPSGDGRKAPAAKVIFYVEPHGLPLEGRIVRARIRMLEHPVCSDISSVTGR